MYKRQVLDSMNDYKAEEGRMPEKSGECLMDQDFAASAGLKVGDSITLLSGTRDPLTDTLQTDTYEITGLGSSVSYISLSLIHIFLLNQFQYSTQYLKRELDFFSTAKNRR